MTKAVSDARKEGDKKAQDEKNKAAAQRSSNTEAIQKVKEELEEQMSTLRKQHDEKVTNLEDRLQVALGAKLEHMMALREEVEQEYADRMEDLRNMYRTEMDAQTETYEKERDKFKNLESSLSETLKVKRQEAEEYRTKADE